MNCRYKPHLSYSESSASDESETTVLSVRYNVGACNSTIPHVRVMMR